MEVAFQSLRNSAIPQDGLGAGLRLIYVMGCCVPMFIFGLLRLGEIVVPSDSAFDEAIQLCMRDISVQSRTACAIGFLKSSKVQKRGCC